jgi:CRP-like cAMP-binding protein
MLKRNPELAFRLIGALAGRLAELAGRIESRSGESALQRLAGFLLDQPCRMSSEGSQLVRLPGNKKTCAAELGMTPETFSRCLSRLAEAGAIHMGRGEIAILAAEVLASHAGED